MKTSARLRLMREDKLDALRSLDRGPRWHGPLRLECPTDGCPAAAQDWTSASPQKMTAPSADEKTSSSDGAGAHHAGYVHIRAQSAGIYITHDGHAAVVQRTRSGRLMPLSELSQLNEEPARRSRTLSWFLRRAASLATDFGSLLKLLRPPQRSGHFRPVH